MDPNQTLANIRAIIRDLPGEPIISDYINLADELIEHVQALDEWLAKGGFPPNDWNQHRASA
jgi:hypothetical protein